MQPKDFRPIALTSVLAKCLERLISPYISDKIADENQFAYKRNRGTDNALMMLIDNVSQHLDLNAQNYTRAVFIDFSSAFNTIDSTLMIEELKEKNINSNITTWISSFLTHRIQTVTSGGDVSTSTETSTGSPQGCVLSPILFTLYVESMNTSQTKFSILKYADDTIILEYINRGENSNMQAEVDNIASWCDKNYLIINSSKTKELLFTNQRHQPNPEPLTIKQIDIERVEKYKYLGTIVTSKLKFSDNTNLVIDKLSKRLYIMKRLSKLGVSPKTIKLAYEAFIESVISFHLAITFKHLSADDIKDLNRQVRIAFKLSGENLSSKSINELYESRLKTKCLRMIHLKNPPMILDKYPSGRFILPKHRTNLRKFCFRHQAVSFLNGLFK